MTSALGRLAANRILRGVLAVLFVGGAGVGLSYVVLQDGHDIVRLIFTPSAVWHLAMAVGLCLAGMFLGMESWRRLLTELGSPVSFWPGSRIFFVSMLGGYLPGSFWRAVAGVHMGYQMDIPAGRMIAAYALNAVLMMLSAAVVGLLAAPGALGGDAVWLVVPALVAALVVGWPMLITRCVRFAGTVFRRDVLSGAPTDAGLRWAMVVQTLGWLVGGLHLWLLAVPLGASPWAALPVCVGGFALAAGAGGLVFVVPDGVGVRELVAMGALTLVLPATEAGVAALASRVSTILAGLLGLAGALVVNRLLNATSATAGQGST